MQYSNRNPVKSTAIYKLRRQHLSDNPVLFVDAFVDYISLKSIGFTIQTIKEKVRPSFHSKVFFKIYLYVYLSGIKNSRKHEKMTNILMQKKEDD